MSLGANYSVYCLSGVLPVPCFVWNTWHREKYRMWWKICQEVFWATYRRVIRHFTRNRYRPRITSKRLVKHIFSVSSKAPIDSDRCRLPTTRPQQQSGQTSFQSVLFHRVHVVSQGHVMNNNNAELRENIPRLSITMEASSWWNRLASKHLLVQNAPGILPFAAPRSLLLVRSLEGRKKTAARDQFSSQKSPGSRLWLSRTGVQHSPGSSTLELPSALAESELLTHPIEHMPRYADAWCMSLTQAFRDRAACLSCATTSRRAPNWSSEEALGVSTISSHNQTAATCQPTGWIA